MRSLANIYICTFFFIIFRKHEGGMLTLNVLCAYSDIFKYLYQHVNLFTLFSYKIKYNKV